jgi:Protein of unknown function (DUF2716)
VFEAAWDDMSRGDSDGIWDQFYEQFRFRPSTTPKGWPGIREPTPSCTLDVSGISEADATNRIVNMTSFVRQVRDIDLKAAAAFRRCTSPSDRIAVLDWQHPSHWLWPHRLDLEDIRRTWDLDPGNTGEGAHYLSWPDMRRSVYPDGDYYIFLAADLSFGTFGHPWEQTICIFGQALLDTGLVDEIALPVIRSDGAPHF